MSEMWQQLGKPGPHRRGLGVVAAVVGRSCAAYTNALGAPLFPKHRTARANVIDTHCHVHDRALRCRSRRKSSSARGKPALRTMLTIGEDLADSRARDRRSRGATGSLAAAGIHPHEAAQRPAELAAELTRCLKRPASSRSARSGWTTITITARATFRRACCARSFALARERGMPVVFHQRDAFDDFTANPARRVDERQCAASCIVSPARRRKRATTRDEFGLLLGIGGVLTFPNARVRARRGARRRHRSARARDRLPVSWHRCRSAESATSRPSSRIPRRKLAELLGCRSPKSPPLPTPTPSRCSVSEERSDEPARVVPFRFEALAHARNDRRVARAEPPVGHRPRRGPRSSRWPSRATRHRRAPRASPYRWRRAPHALAHQRARARRARERCRESSRVADEQPRSGAALGELVEARRKRRCSSRTTRSRRSRRRRCARCRKSWPSRERFVLDRRNRRCLGRVVVAQDEIAGTPVLVVEKERAVDAIALA